MTEIATNLRESEDLRDLLTPRRGRLGLRETDVPPAEVERQQRYGVAVKNETAGKDFRPLREKPLAVPISDGAPSLNRKSDREENVKTFWATRGAPSTLYQLLFQTDPSLEETRIGGHHLASLALALRSAKSTVSSPLGNLENHFGGSQVDERRGFGAGREPRSMGHV